MKNLLALLLLACIAVPSMAQTTAARSRTVMYQFEKTHPCPATGKVHGACPGYVKDHPVPRCAKGPDRVTNMQWQTKGEAHTKDVEENRLCRDIRKGKATAYTNRKDFCAVLDAAKYPIIRSQVCK